MHGAATASAFSGFRHTLNLDTRAFALGACVPACLTVTFITGGGSLPAQAGWGVMAGELLALVILLAVPLQPDWLERLRASRWALAAVALVVALPLLQLLPIPGVWWHAPPFRAALARDLAAAGVGAVDYRWSLAPAATERDLLELLPGVALFVAVQVMTPRVWRTLLWWFIALVAFSVVLAFAQLGAGQHSVLNPFPQYEPAMAGVFANRDHQACAMAMSLVVALMLLAETWRRRDFATLRFGAALAATLLFALVLPLIGSRAGVLLAAIGGAGVIWANVAASSSAGPEHRRWSVRVMSIAALVLLAAGVWGGVAWVEHDTSLGAAGTRWQMLVTTARLGVANAPLGSGFGAYVHAFEQATQGALMGTGYVNNAHDEYAQWWFEAGPLAFVVMLAVAAVLLASIRGVSRLPFASRRRVTGLAAWVALCLPLLHSLVDYPLRTPALMTCFGLLAGIAVAVATDARERAAAGS